MKFIMCTIFREGMPGSGRGPVICQLFALHGDWLSVLKHTLAPSIDCTENCTSLIKCEM